MLCVLMIQVYVGSMHIASFVCISMGFAQNLTSLGRAEVFTLWKETGKLTDMI